MPVLGIKTSMDDNYRLLSDKLLERIVLNIGAGDWSRCYKSAKPASSGQTSR